MQKFPKIQIKKGKKHIPTLNYGKTKVFSDFGIFCLLSHLSDQKRMMGSRCGLERKFQQIYHCLS